MLWVAGAGKSQADPALLPLAAVLLFIKAAGLGVAFGDGVEAADVDGI